MATDNLVSEHLRAIRTDVAGVKATLDEHGPRLSRIEQGIAGLRREQAYDAESTAHQSTRIDRLHQRIERIERRLGLTEE
ncbi:MAG: hypothetical protein L0H73_02490 [Nitrococcus sp.]|nr:hypothetical protein [Nitrococcus sp.]